MTLTASHIIFSGLFLMGGLAALHIARLLKKQFSDKFAVWVKTPAIVTGISVQTFGSRMPSSMSYFPRYRYDYQGNEYSGTSSSGVKKGIYQVGALVEVLVNPANPGESDIPHYFKLGPMEISPFDIAIFVLRAASIVFLAVCLISAVLFLFGFKLE